MVTVTHLSQFSVHADMMMMMMMMVVVVNITGV